MGKIDFQHIGEVMNKEQAQKEEKYKTKCVICGIEIITIKGTANEGICYNCRQA